MKVGCRTPTKGCDGVVGSGKVNDVCGVCGGDGKSCLGCDNIANSGKKNDICNVCDGDGKVHTSILNGLIRRLYITLNFSTNIISCFPPNILINLFP